MSDALCRTEQRIFYIIRDDVCGQCQSRTEWLQADCNHSCPRCYEGYTRQARAIYQQVVKPFEDREQRKG